MKYIDVRGLRLSRFSLGTVQLGLNYGIGNKTGKPNHEQAKRILDCALREGVNSLDTAAAYGDSEQIIGEWLKTNDDNRKTMVVTKPDNLDHSSLEALRSSVMKELVGSKERLGLDTIPLLMIHRFEDYAEDESNMLKVMNELKEAGDIDKWGISAYSHHDYFRLAQSGADAVQIPINVFDWAQINSGGIEALNKANMIVFARSVFLQGLVFQNPETMDQRMSFAFPAVRRFKEFCNEFNMEPALLAASFVLSLKGISCLVLGCETEAQVEANAKLIDKTVTLSDEQMKQLAEAFSDIDPRITNPGKWYNAY